MPPDLGDGKPMPKPLRSHFLEGTLLLSSGSDWLPLDVEHSTFKPICTSCADACWCDCPVEATCEADVHAGLVFEECRAAPPQRELTRRGRRRGNLSGSRQVTMALADLPATVDREVASVA